MESCLHHQLNLLCDLCVKFEHLLKDLFCLLGQWDGFFLHMIFEAAAPYEEPTKIHIAFETSLIVFRLDELFPYKLLSLFAKILCFFLIFLTGADELFQLFTLRECPNKVLCHVAYIQILRHELIIVFQAIELLLSVS